LDYRARARRIDRLSCQRGPERSTEQPLRTRDSRRELPGVSDRAPGARAEPLRDLTRFYLTDVRLSGGLKHMRKRDKELIVVGDRVLVKVEEGEERTNVGLYLPPTAVDNQAVQGGKIIATGPGLPMPSPDSFGADEPWRVSSRETRFVPMQA